MATSTLTISTTPYDLKIQEYAEENSPNITELPTILDPDDYYASNSVIAACGNKKHTFTINGYCDESDRGTFITAMRNNTKVYPVIYPPGSSTNAIETSAYYYITSMSGKFELGINEYWFTMSLIYGG